MNWTMPYPWRSRRDSVRRINMSSEPGNESFFCALRPIPRILSLRRRDYASQVQIGEPSRPTSRLRVDRHRFAWRSQSKRISGSSTKLKNDPPHVLSFKLHLVSLTGKVPFRRFNFSDTASDQACGPGHAGAVDLYFDSMAFWVVLAGHGAGDTLASGKRHKLRDFAERGVCCKELMNEKSL